jgi:DNA integrity scanning protein DisA with diadenylate cyclase activity
VAAIQGNIVDLRQDVLHGLFTLFMVVDLSRATVPAEGVAALVARISEEIEQYLTELGTDGRLVRLQLREVQRQLGHSHVETTEIYTHVNDDDLHAAVGAWAV